MEQATIDSIRQYAEFFNDLRRIAGDSNYYLTQDRIKALGAEFERLNGIVGVIKTDPDREGVKRMLWGWIGPGWPVMLWLSEREEELYKRALFGISTKPQQEIEALFGEFKGVLLKCNQLTKKMAGAVGLMGPIDPVEAGAFFFDDFVRSDRWPDYLHKLDEFRASKPSKRDIAVLAYYLRGAKMTRSQTGWKAWYNKFCKLLRVDAGTYKYNQIEVYCSDYKNEGAYLRVVGPFMGILPQ